jgi:hypothetical protein
MSDVVKFDTADLQMILSRNFNFRMEKKIGVENAVLPYSRKYNYATHVPAK